jgi:hypothetical protein
MSELRGDASHITQLQSHVLNQTRLYSDELNPYLLIVLIYFEQSCEFVIIELRRSTEQPPIHRIPPGITINSKN